MILYSYIYIWDTFYTYLVVGGDSVSLMRLLQLHKNCGDLCKKETPLKTSLNLSLNFCILVPQIKDFLFICLLNPWLTPLQSYSVVRSHLLWAILTLLHCVIPLYTYFFLRFLFLCARFLPLMFEGTELVLALASRQMRGISNRFGLCKNQLRIIYWALSWGLVRWQFKHWVFLFGYKSWFYGTLNSRKMMW